MRIFPFVTVGGIRCVGESDLLHHHNDKSDQEQGHESTHDSDSLGSLVVSSGVTVGARLSVTHCKAPRGRWWDQLPASMACRVIRAANSPLIKMHDLVKGSPVQILEGNEWSIARVAQRNKDHH